MKQIRLNFDPDFQECIVKAGEEANRLEVGFVTDVLVLKALLYTSESEMSDFFKLVNISWSKIKRAINSEVNEWAKEAKKEFEAFLMAQVEALAETQTEAMAIADTVVEEDSNAEETTEIRPEDDNMQDVLYRMCFDEDIINIFQKSDAYLSQEGIIDETAFVLAMLDQPTTRIERFFKEIDIDILVVTRYYEGLLAEIATGMYFNYMNEDLQEGDLEAEESLEKEDEKISELEQSFKDENKQKKFTIPKNLSTFVKVMEVDFSEKSPILGREKETNDLIRILLKAKKSNAILTGKPGVGKTAIVEHLAWLIANKKCPEELNNKKLLSLEVTNVIAGTTLRGMAEERFRLVSEFLSNRDDVILFIDEIHNVVGAGSSSGETLDMANSLKPILAREGISVIGATTDEEYYRIFQKDGAFKRRFEKIEIREPRSNEVYKMIEQQINVLSKHHNIAITKPVVNFAINVSGCFNFETSNPDRTLDIIDRSMATAKMLGKKVVTSKIVMSNFDANFKDYKRFTLQQKLETAYHEAGHYIVARYAKQIPKKALAVSILPAYCSIGEYLGLTVFDPDDHSFNLSWDYDAYLEEIACDLAGRVGEKMLTGKETSGASSDLEHATIKARNMILKYGFAPNFSKRNMENDLYEEKKHELDNEINKIINKAYSIAKRTIKEHEDIFKKVAEALVESGILTCDKLEKLCRESEGKAVIITEPEVSVK